METIGHFEELVLLAIASFVDEAYSVTIVDELNEKTGRRVKLGVVHSALNRLEKKGFLKSSLGEPTAERGGRRKRFYTLTPSGKSVLVKVKTQRDKFWAALPDFAMSKNKNI